VTVHEVLTRRVEQRNTKGILVDDLWCNVSKFAPIDLPPIGTHVKVSVDNKRFIVSLDGGVLEGGVSPDSGKTSQRDATITRLAVLKASAMFVGSGAGWREEVKSDHVLVIADKWLEWVTDPRDGA
jgi:hypothetical protein